MITVKDQLRLVLVWRKLLSTLNEEEGLLRMSELLAKAWGKNVSELLATADISNGWGR